MRKYAPLALALTLSITPFLFTNYTFAQYGYNEKPDYSKYYNEGINFYNRSEYTKAIEQFSQALKLVPQDPAVRNNLAVAYISRGTYFHNNAKDFEKAANNYREAIYYLKYDAPENTKVSPNAAGNLDISIKNLRNANLALGKDDSATNHFNKGKELRAQGNFRGSIVEYFLGLESSPSIPKAYEAIGDMYRILQNEERALKAYEKAEPQNQKDPKLLVKLGTTYNKKGEINKAIDAFNQTLSLDPTNTDALDALQVIWEEQIKLNPRNSAAHTNLGTILQKKGLYDQALNQYKAAEFIDPNNITIRLNMGTLYQAKKDYKTALRAYDTILLVDPKNILALYYKSTALKAIKDYQGATKELNTILQIDPNNTMAKKELITLAKENGQVIPDSVGLLKKSANSTPENAEKQYDAGFIAHSNKDFDTAINYYQRAIELNPKMTKAYINLGTAYIDKQKYDEALKTLKKAAELDPTNNKVQELISQITKADQESSYEKALSLHQQGKIKEAIELYEKALSGSPNDPEILINLGAAEQTIKNYDKAKDLYKQALKIEPRSSVAYFYLGSVLHSTNKLNDAVKNYKKALDLDPGNKSIQESLKIAENDIVQHLLTKALDNYTKKNYEKAQKSINKVLKNYPQNALAHYYLGLTFEAQNKQKDAINSYKKATQLDPKLDSAFYALGVALDKTNDTVNAKNAFRTYIQLAGKQNNELVKYAKERIKQP